MAGGGVPDPSLEPITGKRRAETDEGMSEPDARRGGRPSTADGSCPEPRLALAADMIEDHVIGDHLHRVLPCLSCSTRSIVFDRN
jgi:hypothetical protein